MPDRSDIHEILYAEVFNASKAVEKTKGTLAYESALRVLNRAVARYTDFSLDGKIPDDLQRKKPENEKLEDGTKGKESAA